MPEISKVQLPSGGVYDIKDATARQMISGGVSFIVAWDGASTPVPGNIPYGVTVTYQGTDYTGTLAADSATAGAFYLVRSSTAVGTSDVYDEYVPVGPSGSKSWEKIGDTQVDLSNVVTNVSLSKSTDTVLGADTTFTAASSSVTFSGGTTDVALGEATTFALTSGTVTHGTPTTDTVLGTGTTFTVTDPTITVTPSTTYVKASASGASTAWDSKDTKTVVTGYASPTSDVALGEGTTFALSSGSVTFGTPTTDTFVKSVSAETNKNLVTTTVPNVTSAGSASTWTFTMGTGDASETLIIGGGNSTAPTLGTAITVATGSTSTTGTGDAVVTGVTIGSSASAVTAMPTASVGTGITVGTNDKVTALTGLGSASTASVVGTDSTFTITQPTIALATDSSSATGRVQVATGITSASASGGAVSAVTTGTGSDAVTAIIGMPTSTVGTGITVGTNDKVTAVTGVGTGTAAAQTITVGTNDQVTALTNSTTLNVTYGGSPANNVGDNTF